jgi:hypothetical protein
MTIQCCRYLGNCRMIDTVVEQHQVVLSRLEDLRFTFNQAPTSAEPPITQFVSCKARKDLLHSAIGGGS